MHSLPIKVLQETLRIPMGPPVSVHVLAFAVPDRGLLPGQPGVEWLCVHLRRWRHRERRQGRAGAGKRLCNSSCSCTPWPLPYWRYPASLRHLYTVC